MPRKNYRQPSKPLPPPRRFDSSSLAGLFLRQAEKYADQPFLWHRQGANFVQQSYREVAERAKSLAGLLIVLGIKPGDRILLASENRPEWIIADLAILLAGAISVPAYATNSASDHAFILSHSGARGAIASQTQMANLRTALLTHGEACGFVLNLDEPAGSKGSAWNSKDIAEEEIEERVRAQKRQDLCSIIYTSGTGGRPKGVMISHGGFMSVLEAAHALLEDIAGGRERFLCFLPLSHAYEHCVGMFWPISLGAEIYFAGPLEKMAEDFSLVKPTLMTAVPRLYEILYQRLERSLGKLPSWQRFAFRLALRLGRQKLAGRDSFWEWPLDALLDLLVRRKIRARFGGRLKAFISGGAALDPEIGNYFLALGVRILQGYGQTESSPVISVNPPYDIRIETVGPPLPGIEVKLARDGEILVRGPNLMMGYWKDEEASAKALEGGWLHTGDVGEIDSDGYLRITDRKKDIIVLSGGDTLSPAKLEQELCREPEIAQAFVWGDGKPHLAALLVPDAAFASQWARNKNMASFDLNILCRDANFTEEFARLLNRVNARLGQTEKIRKFLLLPEAFTIENQMLTPTLKLRRHRVRECYRMEMDSLY